MRAPTDIFPPARSPSRAVPPGGGLSGRASCRAGEWPLGHADAPLIRGKTPKTSFFTAFSYFLLHSEILSFFMLVSFVQGCCVVLIIYRYIKGKHKVFGIFYPPGGGPPAGGVPRGGLRGRATSQAKKCSFGHANEPLIRGKTPKNLVFDHFSLFPIAQ